MFIFDVVPLTFIPLSQPQILSYFSPNEALKGSVVEVSLGKRKSLAVVIRCESINKRKAAIKHADFSLKPINKILISTSIFAPVSFQLANFLSHYYFIPLSFAMKTVLPKNLTALINSPLTKSLEPVKPNNKDARKKTELSIINMNFAALANLIPSLVNKNNQALILTPTIFHQEYYYQKFKKELPNINLVNYSPSLPKKQYHQLYQQLLNSRQNCIILGPKSAIFLPWTKLSLIVIIDPANHTHLTTQKLPHYNAITLSKNLANYFNAQLTYFQNY